MDSKTKEKLQKMLEMIDEILKIIEEDARKRPN